MFCFLWSESDNKCRETFGKCQRSTAMLNDKDWYEPCEPELEKHALPWFYFVTNEEALTDNRKLEYLKESKDYWKQ